VLVKSAPRATLDRELLTDVIGDKSLLSKASRLGRALFAMRDRQFGALRIAVASRASNMTRWRVVAVPQAKAAS
jgi:hypothetical protein